MTEPLARAEMLIRRPVAEVFDAFVQPAMITRFWLDSTTGPLGPAARVDWRFMVPGAKETVSVTTFEVARHLAFDWSDGIHVDMRFESLGEDLARVTLVGSGFGREESIAHVLDATEGFAIVLCDLKILLETGRAGNLVRDKAQLIARA